MSKDKRKYLEAYIPEVKPKETPKRSGMKSDGRLDEIEEAIRAFNDLLTKQNRDNLDAMYNIDMDNMSSSMRRLFQSYSDDISEAQASIKTMADANGATVELLAQWFGKDENGKINQTSESILTMFAGRDTAFNSLKSTVVGENGSGGLVKAVSEVSTQANNNGSAISALQSAVYTTDADGNQITALAKFQNEVSTTYAKTSQFSTFKSEIEGSVSQTLAGFTTEADKTYAKTSQFAAILDEDGNVSFAEIAAGVSDDESFIELIADKVDVSGFVTFESLENDGDGAATVNGNNLALVADAYCDSISQLNFKKWRYTDYDYNTEDNRLENMAVIKAIDDGRSAPDDSRYAMLIQTYDVYFNNTPYDIALKLVAQGAFSVETNYSAYIAAAEYCTIDALWNTRIRADRDFEDARSAAAVASNDYSFNTDGIYYGGKRIVDNSKEV